MLKEPEVFWGDTNCKRTWVTDLISYARKKIVCSQCALLEEEALMHALSLFLSYFLVLSLFKKICCAGMEPRAFPILP